MSNNLNALKSCLLDYTTKIVYFDYINILAVFANYIEKDKNKANQNKKYIYERFSKHTKNMIIHIMSSTTDDEFLQLYDNNINNYGINSSLKSKLVKALLYLKKISLENPPTNSTKLKHFNKYIEYIDYIIGIFLKMNDSELKDLLNNETEKFFNEYRIQNTASSSSSSSSLSALPPPKPSRSPSSSQQHTHTHIHSPSRSPPQPLSESASKLTTSSSSSQIHSPTKTSSSSSSTSENNPQKKMNELILQSKLIKGTNRESKLKKGELEEKMEQLRKNYRNFSFQ